MLKKLLCLGITMLLSVSSLVSAEDKIYKWRADDGTIIYSDVPPAEGGAEEVPHSEPMPATSGPADASRELMLRKSEEIGTRMEQRAQRRQALHEEIEKLNKEIAKAEEEYEQGKAPQEGEIKRLAGGSTRLAPAYFERLEREQQALEALRQRRKALHAELQTLR